MPKKVIKENVLEKLPPILLVATVILAFAVGILWQKVSTLEGGKTTEEVQPTDVAQPPTEGKLSEDQAGKVEKVSDKDHIILLTNNLTKSIVSHQSANIVSS